MKLPKKLIRLALLAAVVVGGYFLYQHLSPSQRQDIKEQANKTAQTATVKVKGLADSFNIDYQSILDQANKKFLEKQPIIDEGRSIDISDQSIQDQTDQDQLDKDQSSSTVKGTSDTQDIAKQLSNRLLEQIKDLPRKQAAEITRQICEQLIKELEEEPSQ